VAEKKLVSDYQLVPALLRGTKILELLSRKSLLTMEVVSNQSEIPRTTVFRILTTLEALGYVKRERIDGIDHWSLGLKLLDLTKSMLSRLDLRNEVHKIMEDLAEQTDEFVQLGILHNGKVMYIDHIKRSKPLTMYAEVGSQLPINISAAGMVISASLKTEELDKLLSEQKFPKNTPKTTTDPDKLRKILKTIARQGYAYDDQQYAIGVRCIAAPICDYTGRVIAAINVTGSLLSFTDEMIETFVEKVKQAAKAASRKMGYRPSP
jgi:IclR family acetate operon transcriptional repressor